MPRAPHRLPYNAALGAHLRALRRERSWTLRELGDRSGRDLSTLCSYESGTRCPSGEALVALCETFEIGVFELLADVAHTYRRDHDPWCDREQLYEVLTLDGVALFAGFPDRCLPGGPVRVERHNGRGPGD